MLMRMNPKTKQEIKTALEREVQEEIRDLHLKEGIHQMKRRNGPVEYARKPHIKICLGVQILGNIYQESQMEQKVFLRKYAHYA